MAAEDQLDKNALQTMVQALAGVETEDELIGEYSTKGNGENQSIDFVGKWFPDEHEWQGKTNITAKQARALALMRHMPEFFEELEPMRGFIEGVVTDYEMYLTSIDGASREQQMKILMALFGGGEDADVAENAANLARLFANPDGKDDD